METVGELKERIISILNDIQVSSLESNLLRANRYELAKRIERETNHFYISLANRAIVNLDNERDHIEQWTVDKDTAFQIDWDLNIVPRAKRTLIRQAQQVSDISSLLFILISVNIEWIPFISTSIDMFSRWSDKTSSRRSTVFDG